MVTLIRTMKKNKIKKKKNNKKYIFQSISQLLLVDLVSRQIPNPR